MDRSKLPQRIHKPLPMVRKPLLAAISENAINVASTATSMASSINDRPTFRPNALRRRSKSISDLRSNSHHLAKKKIESFAAPSVGTALTATTKTNVIRPTGTKRPAADKPSGPKAKKIPDWDYKSRFLNLKEKHITLQESLKNAQKKLTDLENTEITLESLSEANDKLAKTNAIYREKIDNLQKLNVNLKQKEEKLQEELSKETVENAEKSKQLQEYRERLAKIECEYQSCKAKYSESATEIKNLRATNSNLSSELDHCKTRLLEQENLRRSLHNTIQDLKGNIRVFCRVRPVLPSELQQMELNINYIDECTFEIRKSRESISVTGRPNDMKMEFNYDRVFPSEATQEDVFEELANLVQSALDGYNVCVFAYGQTGSGKTYTMQGVDSPGELGLIPRTIKLIFAKIDELRRLGWQYEIEASFLEIYNETVNDLMNKNSSTNCEIRYNEGRVIVQNLNVRRVETATEFLRLMFAAQGNRSVAATDFNEQSSRSHAVTKIGLTGYHSVSNTAFNSSINLVDLAGSESAKTSSVDRLVETKNINKSLSTLGNVMLALHNKNSHIPYRDSKLTFLLQSSLGGNSKTAMFVNISPLEDGYTESITSLRFAAKVKEVRTGAKRNKTFINNRV